ncbi:MAG: hypothetical protein V1820_03460 [archaeon]
MAEEQTRQAQLRKSGPFSFPVLAMAIGGGLILLPWIGGLGTDFLTKLAVSAVGIGLLVLGFLRSK